MIGLSLFESFSFYASVVMNYRLQIFLFYFVFNFGNGSGNIKAHKEQVFFIEKAFEWVKQNPNTKYFHPEDCYVINFGYNKPLSIPQLVVTKNDEYKNLNIGTPL